MPFEFAPFDVVEDGVTADVTVVETEVPLSEGSPFGTVGVVVRTPRVGGMRIADGVRIEVERHPDCTEEALRLMLMGQGAAMVLHQRHVIPLHGSAVLADRGAVLVLGHSGAGKSTTLGALVGRGLPALCDDLSAVRVDGGVPVVEPGSRVVKVWADSAESLGWSVEGLPEVLPSVAKYVAPLPLRSLEPAPVVAVYRLSPHPGEAIEVKPLRGMAAANALLDHVWAKRAVVRGGMQRQHFELVMALASAVPVVDVRRPARATVDADTLAGLLLDDMRSRVRG